MLLAVFLIATEGLFRYVHKLVGGAARINTMNKDRQEKKRVAKKKRRARKGKLVMGQRSIQQMTGDEILENAELFETGSEESVE